MPSEKKRKSDQTAEKAKTFLYIILAFIAITGLLGGGIITAYILPAAGEIAREVVEERAFPQMDGALMQQDIEYIKEDMRYIKDTVDKILEKINKDNGK